MKYSFRKKILSARIISWYKALRGIDAAMLLFCNLLVFF